MIVYYENILKNDQIWIMKVKLKEETSQKCRLLETMSNFICNGCFNFFLKDSIEQIPFALVKNKKLILNYKPIINVLFYNYAYNLKYMKWLQNNCI